MGNRSGLWGIIATLLTADAALVWTLLAPLHRHPLVEAIGWVVAVFLLVLTLWLMVITRRSGRDEGEEVGAELRNVKDARLGKITSAGYRRGLIVKGLKRSTISEVDLRREEKP